MKEFSIISSMFNGTTVLAGEIDSFMNVALKLSGLDDGRSPSSDSDSLASFSFFRDLFPTVYSFAF